MLSIANLVKDYGRKVHALRGVDLEIGTGMFGLVGPNGAGKTTLMRILAGLLRPTSGKVSVLGHDPSTRGGKLAVKAMLGYLPQELGLYPDLNVLEFMEYVALLKGLNDRTRREKQVYEIIELVGLTGESRRKMRTFSGGMKRRVGIAQAMLGSPQLLIVDEPTSGLDPEERVRFRNLLAEMAGRCTIILSTHIIEDVSELCTSMAVIDRGVVRYTGSPREAIAGIRGTTWRREVDRAELAEIERNHTVLSKRLAGGTTIIHVSSARQPDPSFEAVEPDLRDVYFTYLSHNGKSQ